MTTEQEKELYAKLCELDGEKVLGLVTDYHGTQLLDDGFAQHCVDSEMLELDWVED